MDFYHGSAVAGLTELKPFASPYSHSDEARVYLTLKKQLAIHYIWNTGKYPIKTPMLHVRQDGVLVFQEMFEDALEYFYKGLSGYVYRCAGEYNTHDQSGAAFCVTSSTPVAVVDCTPVDDVYDRVLSYEKKGRFIYEKYKDLPPYRHDIIRGIIVRSIKKDDLFNNPQHPNYIFYQLKYPQYWREAEVLYKNGLL
ncbi:MAG: hypothetical protein LBV27_07900 [Oscillospiraceae bacterium]|jgi:hypothetical protein|nr:hypothetical protein [Oscillospiraceae bacterium]